MRQRRFVPPNFRCKLTQTLPELKSELRLEHGATADEVRRRLEARYRERYATTHSPLIVAGLAQNELYILRRDANEAVKIERPPSDLKGWRVDQVLTSPSFGLGGAREFDTVNDVARYGELASKFELNLAEQRELKNLAEKIKVTLPAPETTARAREASQMIEQVLQAKLDALPAKEKDKMVQEIRLQVSDAVTGTRRPT